VIETSDSAKAKTVASFRGKSSAQTTAPVRENVTREDVTLQFTSETARPNKASRPVPAIRKPAMLALTTLVLLAVAGAVFAGLTLRAPAPATGSLVVESEPQGAEVVINAVVRGLTPLTLTLPTGTHPVVVRRGTNVKQLNVEIAGGDAKSYHVAWAAEAPAAVAAATGSLSVVSDPPGSTVIVDGSARGQTPLTIRDLAPGRHDVLVRSSSSTYQRSVQVDAGATASLVVGGGPAAGPSWGWITLQTPFPVQVLEDGRVVGTSEIDRIMLSPGNHQLDFVNDQFGFRQGSRVSVTAGRGGPVSLTIPRMAMNINALPWAEVYIDGARIGDTPLANVMQPIGDHEIVFRHPQLGEKRQVARLTQREPLRVSVDMRQ
jgi:PEGA domain